MKEKEIIESTKAPNTYESIYNDLVSLGIKQDDTLLVHSSLSSIGWTSGGAHAVIMALLSCISKGTLIMPTHSGDLSDPANWRHPPVPKEWFQIIYDTMPAYDKELTPTRGMGKMPELFRGMSKTLRSDHPQVSFAAQGVNAKKITENHALTPQMGVESPLGKLYNSEAKILLLGVGYDSCTSFHLAETMIDGMPKEKMGTPLKCDGVRRWKWFEDFAYDSDDFEKLGGDFEKEYNVIKGKVGNAECRLMDMKTAVDFAVKWIEKTRGYT